MDRRTFIGTLTGSLLVAPLAAEAQQAAKVYRLGFLLLFPRDVQLHLTAAFEAGLREKGYVLGREVVIEYRSGDGNFDQLPILAAELVRLRVNVIVTGVNPAALAAKRATGTIPIVMAATFFPVEDGLVASLARPGGNITGLTQEAGEEVAKRLQLLREVVPKLTRVATLSGVGMSYNPYFQTTLQGVARGLGVSILPFEIGNAEDVTQAFVDIERARADGMIVFNGPLTLAHRSAIIGLAARKRLPAIWGDRERVVDGGLMSYGADVADLYRRAAGYVDHILKGAKPADLPVQQPTKFVLAINLKTAMALGITIPQSLLVRADDVIR
jgi:putative tryptophan/tyrosine transport system substrate-binding protein